MQPRYWWTKFTSNHQFSPISFLPYLAAFPRLCQRFPPPLAALSEALAGTFLRAFSTAFPTLSSAIGCLIRGFGWRFSPCLFHGLSKAFFRHWLPYPRLWPALFLWLPQRKTKFQHLLGNYRLLRIKSHLNKWKSHIFMTSRTLLLEAKTNKSLHSFWGDIDTAEKELSGEFLKAKNRCRG